MTAPITKIIRTIRAITQSDAIHPIMRAGLVVANVTVQNVPNVIVKMWGAFITVP